jgi:hypothetical protein
MRSTPAEVARRAAAASLLVLAATGCAAYRPPVPLDESERAELAAIGGRLRDRGVRVVAPVQDEDWPRQNVIEALDAVGVAVYRRVAEPRPTDVELRADVSSKHASDWGLFLFVYTLGLIPYSDDGRQEYRLELWPNSGPAATVACAVESPTIAGWLAIPAGLRPGWRWFHGDADSEHTAESSRLGLLVARRIDDLVSGK